MKCLFVLTAVALMTAGIAHGQGADTASATKVQIARKLYDEGVEAASKGQWSLAYDKFKSSYELQARSATLFNLASAQAQTGRLVEASESYRRFLRETDSRYADSRADATSQLDSIEKQIARLTLQITNLEQGDVVTVDDIEFPQSVLREPIPMNPGAHVVVVRRGSSMLVTRQITLATGAAESMQIDVQAKVDLTLHPADGASQTTGTGGVAVRDEPEVKRSVLRSPWLWSAAAIVIVGSVTATYFLTRGNDDVLEVR
ncbi:MAG TPA: hypothetical protein VFT22_15545 [Kofleriaceae bacterium]|nr:hypothetical protein [Kofleriaceae bacterium]